MKTIEQLKNDFVTLSKDVTDLLTSYTLEIVSFERPCGNDIFVYFPDRIHVIWNPEKETQGCILFWGEAGKDFTLQETDVIRLMEHISKLYAQLQ